jgi:sugar lactone lactonase YvrE
VCAATAFAQTRDARVTRPSLPNPYRLVPDWPTLPTTMKGPNGRKWGEVIRVHVARNGNIWVFNRCFHDKPTGDATCLNRGGDNPPILEFNAAGTLLRSLGVGLFAHPHGFTVDRDGNLWATDSNDQESILGMPAKNAQGAAMGQTVLKISPDGKVLMTLGTPGVAGTGQYQFDRPTGVAIAANGDIFVSDGHAPNKSNSGRIVKYSPKGTFIKAWGRLGSELGNFRDPHDLYVGGSRGYVYVADRQNNRIQVFDQNGTLVTAWTQFGQPSSVYVDARDNIYVGATYQDPSRGESLTGPTTGPNDRAIVIANAITGELKYLIPDPGDLSKMTDTGSSASGIAVDEQGNIYAADVGFNNLRKYVWVQ